MAKVRDLSPVDTFGGNPLFLLMVCCCVLCVVYVRRVLPILQD